MCGCGTRNFSTGLGSAPSLVHWCYGVGVTTVGSAGVLAAVDTAVAAGNGLFEPIVDTANNSTIATRTDAYKTNFGIDGLGMRRCTGCAAAGRKAGGSCCGVGAGARMRAGGENVRSACIHCCWLVGCIPLADCSAYTMALQLGKRWPGSLASARSSGAACGGDRIPPGGG